MHRHSKLPARFLWVLLGTILIAVGMTSVSLARTETVFHGPDEFIILKATSTTAYFTIDDSCSDIDENCTVIVRRNIALGAPTPQDNMTMEDVWSGLLHCRPSRSGQDQDERNSDFDICWRTHMSSATYTVEWPVIRPDDDFEITPHCKSGNAVCAEELIVCYNAADCDNNDFERASWDQVGDLWDEAGSCLYDDDDDDVQACLSKAFDDWLDDNMHINDDYDDLEDEEEDERGFTLEDYENDLNDVGNRPSTRRSETVLERSRQQGTSRTSPPVYQPVDTQGPGYRPTRDAYLTVNFTAYLETNSPYQICNTTIGCFTVATLSNTFRSHMQNLHIVIQDTGVLSCMGRVGWDVGNHHAVPFDNANLIACDARIRTANQVCPAKDTGASADLLTMWDTGLLTGILFATDAQALRLQVERARDRTPACLCTAGFAESNFVVTPEATAGPWERSSGLRTEDVCN